MLWYVLLERNRAFHLIPPLKLEGYQRSRLNEQTQPSFLNHGGMRLLFALLNKEGAMPTFDTKDRKLLSTQETSEFLGMSTHWVKAARQKPELAGPPFLKIGNAVRYDIRDLDTWLDQRRFRGTYEFNAGNGEG